MKAAIATLLLLAPTSLSLRPPIRRRAGNAPNDSFDFANITPKPYLEYHNCNGLQCARLEVPLNWNSSSSDPEADEKAAVAIVRLPARVSVADPRYGGAVLINSGGPGGSGTADVWDLAPTLQLAVDAAYAYNSSTYVSPNPNAKYFDIIGFDPRGVNQTTPFFNCARDPSVLAGSQASIQTPLLGTPEGHLDQIWAQTQALYTNCAWDPVKNPNGSKMALYSSTTQVARDLVEIIERHGEWREKQTDCEQIQKRLAWKNGQELLNAWFISYGTDLGQTFATMFPSKVARVYLTGVDDAEDYYTGKQVRGLLDTDNIVNKFFEYCAKAGKNRCGLWGGPSANDTEANLEAILRDIDENGPIIVQQDQDMDGVYISQSDVYDTVFGLTYSPNTNAEPQSHVLGDLLHRNGSRFREQKFKSLQQLFSATGKPLTTPIDGSDLRTETLPSWINLQSLAGIQCAETALRRNKTEMKMYLDFLKKQSKWGWRNLGTDNVECAAYPMFTTWNSAADQAIGSNHTAHPILFGSTTNDPVCPYANARLGQSRFPGSGLVVADGEGHAAESAASWRVLRGIRHYFQTGELPGECSVDNPCLPLKRPFGLTERTEDLPEGASMELQSLVQVAERY